MKISGKTKFRITPLKRTRKNKKQNRGVYTMPILKYVGIALGTISLMFLVYFYKGAGVWFKASVLEAPQPFNGTVFPVSKVPDWANWTGNNATTLYSAIDQKYLVDLPAYDLTKMTFPDSQLVWGNKSQDSIRNTKITYPVVYMGNYELDHVENAGSHLGIDIKMPVGTPVHAIANGKVVKASTQSSGFGHHIVIKHINAPNPATGKTETLYSCYVHLDQVNVSEGQNVLKGDLIGTSGNTGTSTTPHLHFQIDNDSAPWHPYWPFTWNESQAAGLSFFEAVNAGLGMANAQAYTVNPMKFVTQNLGSYAIVADIPGGTDNPSDDTDTTSDDTNTSTTTTTTTTNEDPVVEVVENPDTSAPQTDTSLFVFDISGGSASMIGTGVTLTVTDSNNQISKMSDADSVKAEISGVGRLIKSSFKKSDFVNGTIKVSVNSDTAGTANILIGKSGYQVNFVEKAAVVSSLRIEHDGYFQTSVLEEVKIVALDENGNPTPTINFSGTISVEAKEGNAIIIPDRLAVNNFQNGVATIKVKVSNSDRVVLRAQNGAIVGESEPLTVEDKQIFTDVGRGNDHYDAIKYLYDNGIVSGYSDGTFQPNKTVNRAEALKMLMLAFNVGTGPAQALTFTDTDNSAWYATTLGTAVAKEIVAGYGDGTFKPAQTVNKAEYLKMIFKTNGIEVTDSISANPYADVPKDAWYAPYAYLTNRKNLLDVPDNLLDPANGMTRGDVAETIYRLKYVLDNNLVTYSK
jgi:murein DD-endopeptidase MepM/ murein hydrolase activator NlpD